MLGKATKDSGIATNVKRKSYSRDLKNKAAQCFDAGETSKEVAEKLGVPLGTVSFWLTLRRAKNGVDDSQNNLPTLDDKKNIVSGALCEEKVIKVKETQCLAVEPSAPLSIDFKNINECLTKRRLTDDLLITHGTKGGSCIHDVDDRKIILGSDNVVIKGNTLVFSEYSAPELDKILSVLPADLRLFLMSIVQFPQGTDLKLPLNQKEIDGCGRFNGTVNLGIPSSATDDWCAFSSCTDDSWETPNGDTPNNNMEVDDWSRFDGKVNCANDISNSSTDDGVLVTSCTDDVVRKVVDELYDLLSDIPNRKMESVQCIAGTTPE